MIPMINNLVVDVRAEVNYVVIRNEQLNIVLRAAQDQNAKTTSDDINETTAAVDSPGNGEGLPLRAFPLRGPPEAPPPCTDPHSEGV